MFKHLFACLLLHGDTDKKDENAILHNGHGHMTKMATMPIYGKTSKIIFSGTKRPVTLKLSMQHQVLKY